MHYVVEIAGMHMWRNEVVDSGAIFRNPFGDVIGFIEAILIFNFFWNNEMKYSFVKSTITA